MIKGSKPLVAGLGEVLWDIFPSGKRAGGAPVNFVYHASQLGAEGFAISAAGNDDSGKELLAELQNNGIKSSIQISRYPTGSVSVELDHGGTPSYVFAVDVAWDHLSVTEEAAAIVSEADAVSFGTLASRSEGSRRSIQTLLSYAQKNALKVFDINLRQDFYSKSLIEELLTEANVLKINNDEAAILGEMFDVSGSAESVCGHFLEKRGFKYVIFTAGERHSIIYSQQERSKIETPKIKITDTVGAGDAFSGAFVYSILVGKTLTEAHRKAVDVAAFVCTQRGAWPKYTKDLL